ncbi:MAG TPA: glycosyltransferase [Cytophagaceae bacterium]
MKIIQINASYKPAFIYGGPTMSVSKLSEVLASQGIDLNVLTTCANGDQELDVVLGQKIILDQVPVTYYKRLTKDHTHFSPALYLALWNRLKTERRNTANNDILIHVHTWWNLVSVICCMISVFKKVPVVLSPRGTLSAYSFGNRNNLFKNIIFKITKPLLNRCHVHVTSENERKAIISLLQPKTVTVIPNLVSLPANETLNLRKDINEEEFKLLFFSRIEEKKGLEMLFSALATKQLNYQLTIAGSGDSKYIGQLKNLAKSLDIHGRISWIGQQPAEYKFSIMADHDLMVLPSYDENFANVVIESLATGTAVLVTENVGLSDYVLKNDFGWVCIRDDIHIRDGLLNAASNRQKLRNIRERAPLIIREDFSDQLLGQRYIMLYNEVITSK